MVSGVLVQFRRSYRCPKDLTHLMVASWLGQGTVVERLLKEGGDINARCKRYGTALNIAALRKDEGISERCCGGMSRPI